MTQNSYSEMGEYQESLGTQLLKANHNANKIELKKVSAFAFSEIKADTDQQNDVRSSKKIQLTQKNSIVVKCFRDTTLHN